MNAFEQINGLMRKLQLYIALSAMELKYIQPFYQSYYDLFQ